LAGGKREAAGDPVDVVQKGGHGGVSARRRSGQLPLLNAADQRRQGGGGGGEVDHCSAPYDAAWMSACTAGSTAVSHTRWVSTMTTRSRTGSTRNDVPSPPSQP